MFHKTSAEAGEEHNAKGHEVEVVETGSIFPSLGVVMRQREELGGIWPCFGHANVCEQKQSYKVERDACLTYHAISLRSICNGQYMEAWGSR
jgi:hypothetical protein